MIIAINFKNYKKGEGVLNLARKINNILGKAIVAVPTSEIKEISKKTNLEVYAQHIDFQSGNKNTGFILPESIKSDGAKGTLINHSEHKLSIKEIEKSVLRCKNLGLSSIVFAGSKSEYRKIISFRPNAIAYEDEKLISSGKSITKSEPEEIREFTNRLKRTKIIPLCGAGIHSAEDCIEAKNLGCKGVVISSAIANSKNPQVLLKELKRVIK